jgi:hypothetical protein
VLFGCSFVRDGVRPQHDRAVNQLSQSGPVCVAQITARFTITSNTGFGSPGEAAIARNTATVAP